MLLLIICFTCYQSNLVQIIDVLNKRPVLFFLFVKLDIYRTSGRVYITKSSQNRHLLTVKNMKGSQASIKDKRKNKTLKNFI